MFVSVLAIGMCVSVYLRVGRRLIHDKGVQIAIFVTAMLNAYQIFHCYHHGKNTNCMYHKSSM